MYFLFRIREQQVFFSHLLIYIRSKDSIEQSPSQYSRVKLQSCCLGSILLLIDYLNLKNESLPLFFDSSDIWISLFDFTIMYYDEYDEYQDADSGNMGCRVFNWGVKNLKKGFA